MTLARRQILANAILIALALALGCCVAGCADYQLAGRLTYVAASGHSVSLTSDGRTIGGSATFEDRAGRRFIVTKQGKVVAVEIEADGKAVRE